MSLYKGCKNCIHYEGDCGNHAINEFGHTMWHTPQDSSCFEPTKEYLESEKYIMAHNLATKYPKEILEEAAEICSRLSAVHVRTENEEDDGK